MSWLLKGEII